MRSVMSSVLNAVGHDSRTLSVFIVEPNKEMQRLLRGMLINYGIRDVSVFADSARASAAILSEPPAIVILDWESVPHPGADFLKLIRHKNMYPVCLVPIIVMLSEARRRCIERAMRLGAHAVLAKPMSPEVLMARIKWVLSGQQQLRLVGDRYVVDGVHRRLEVERERQDQLESAREFQASQFDAMDEIQQDVDRLLESGF